MLITLLKNYLVTKYRAFNSREELENWQNQKVLRHLKWVMKHSPFYRSLYKDLEIENWREFPMIEKKEMMENFDLLNTCQIGKEAAFKIAIGAEENPDTPSLIGNITIGLSTGTSGGRGLFLVSPYERFGWAGCMLAKALPKGFVFRHKIAFFFRVSSPLYATLNLQLYHLQDSMDEHLKKLEKQQPTIIVAPPSMLLKLARFSSIKPEKIISVAEVLDPIDEAFITKAFNQKVHQIYQATEGFLGVTCAHGTIHLNEDLLVIQKETIPGSNAFYPIITDFSRLSQPIIRYRLNDILEELETKCPCGSHFTAIKAIQGRSDDIFILPNGKQVFPDFIRRAIISADPRIEEYRVIQTGERNIEISIKTASLDESEIQATVRLKLKALFGECELAFTPYKEIEPAKKMIRITRRVSPK